MALSDDPDQLPAAGPGVRLPGLRHNPEGSMPLLEHIRELRNRIFKALLFITAGAIAGWYLYPHIWHFIEAPYCRLTLRSHVQVVGQHGQNCQLFVTGIFDAFFLRLKIAIIAGVILSSPLWLYQLWAFLAPGLYARERRWAYFFAGSAVPLFALGYAIAMLTIFGIAFELPLGFVLLNVAGVLTHRRFAKWRRMIIFFVFLFAAVATPSPDPISMLLLAVPCVALVELAEVFAFFNDRRRARALAANPFPGLSASEVAAYGLASGEPDSAEPVDVTGGSQSD